MKSKAQTPETLDDFIFENRNKNYGAYYIRSTYSSSVKKAITLSLSVFILGIFLTSHFAFRNTNHKVSVVDPNPIIELHVYDIPKAEEPKFEPSQPAAQTMKPEVISYKPVVALKKEEPKVEEKKTIEKPIVASNPNGEGDGDPSLNPNSAGKTGGGKTGSTAGQEETSTAPITWAEEMPEYIGGDKALRNYIITHFKVPNNIDESNIRVQLWFVVDESGKVIDITVKKGVNSSLNEEAIRVVSGMPNWKPGKMGGKAVKVRYLLPINIKFQ